MLMGSLDQNLHAEEIAPIRFTGYEGYVEFRYLSDEQSNIQTSPLKRSEDREAFQEELNFQTHSYIYLPQFLKMDLGGGPVLVQNSIEVRDTDSNGVETIQANKFSDTLFNYNVRLNFLSEKDYPFSFFYERNNPLVSPSLNEQFLQENTRYGADLTWRTPVVFTLNNSTYITKGTGFNLVVDEKIEQTNFRAYRSFGQDGYAQLLYQYSDVDSRSGSLSLPIIPSRRISRSTNFDTRYTFGGIDQYQFTAIASQIDQNPAPNLSEFKFNPEFRWKHTKTMQSFYRMNYLNSEQEEHKTKINDYIVGLSDQRNVGFSQLYDVHSKNNESDSTDEVVTGVLATLGYNFKFKDGNLNFGLSHSYDERDQKSTQSTIPVFNERHVLSGTTPVTLNHDFITQPVSANIKVYNLPRTQLYVEGIDYRLIEIGSIVQIQRLASGNILDGEEVVVDYNYTTGGTFKSTSFYQSYDITVNYFKYFDTFVRYKDNDNTLKEGIPTNSLNSSTNTSYGGGVNYPATNWLTLAADTVYEEHEEEIAPYDRKSTNGSIQFNMPLSTSLALSRRRTLVDQKTSAEDVDLTHTSIRFRMRPWARSTFSYAYVEETDVGGTIPRSLKEHTLDFEWRFRELRFRVDGRIVDEEQGTTIRDREAIHLSIRRDF